jgi:hypothetical protein
VPARQKLGMHYDLGYFDLEQKTLQPLDNPFGTRLSPMSWVRGVTHVSGPDLGGLAEREGFEPPIGLHLCRISSAVRSTTLPPLQAPKRVESSPSVGASSRRGRLGRQGAARGKFPAGKPWLAKSGTAGRDKNRRSRVAPLKLRPGSAASLANLRNILTVANASKSATRSRF